MVFQAALRASAAAFFSLRLGAVELRFAHLSPHAYMRQLGPSCLSSPYVQPAYRG